MRSSDVRRVSCKIYFVVYEDRGDIDLILQEQYKYALEIIYISNVIMYCTQLFALGRIICHRTYCYIRKELRCYWLWFVFVNDMANPNF